MDTKLRVRGVRNNPEEETVRQAVQDCRRPGDPQRRGRRRGSLRGAPDQGLHAPEVGGRVRVHGRRRVPRKREPQGQQGLRDRQAREADRGSGARERPFKKYPGLLESRPCVRFQFPKEHRGEFGPIKKACEALGISKSGYYEYLGRRKPNAQIEREALEQFVKECFERHKGRYGYRRINRELRREGIFVSEKRVLKVMGRLGLQAKGATRKHREAGNGRPEPGSWAGKPANRLLPGFP